MIRVTIWNEFRHEKTNARAMELYPNGIHATIGEFLSKEDDIEVTLAALDDPDQGLPDEVLNNTDVLIWWGHMAHHEVPDDLVARIRQRVYTGKMGLIVMHSGHHSKPFRALMGTSCNLKWRDDDEKEILWVVDPAHPIVQGIGENIILEKEEINTFRGKDHDFLMEIRNGKFLDKDSHPLPEFYEMVSEYESRLKYAAENSSLPDKPDYDAINEFLMSVNERIVKGAV